MAARSKRPTASRKAACSPCASCWICRVTRQRSRTIPLPLFWPSCVLLDIGLPDIDGYETARRIRALSGGDRMRLIAVTGWGQQEDKQRARAAGFDAHLTKPVELAAVSALLAEKAKWAAYASLQ